MISPLSFTAKLKKNIADVLDAEYSLGRYATDAWGRIREVYIVFAVEKTIKPNNQT